MTNQSIAHIDAARALRRILNTSKELRDLEEAYRCDAHYDGGEWSGPAYERLFQEAEDKIYQFVADKFNISVGDLSQAFIAYRYGEQDIYLDHILAQRTQV